MQTIEQFGAGFQDGHVGGKAGVKHLAKPHHPQCRHHFAQHSGFFWYPKFFAQHVPHRRGYLYHHMLCGILDGVEDLLGIVLDQNGGYRTGFAALVAEDAVGLVKREVIRRGDGIPAGAARVGEGPHALLFRTGAHAPAATDALGKIAQQAGAGILHGGFLDNFGQAEPVGVQTAAQGLQHTVAVAAAIQAVLVVVGEDHFQNAGLYLLDLLGVGKDLHAFPHHGGARGQQLAVAGHFDYAHTAVRLDGLIRAVAQMRDVDMGQAGRLNHAGSLLDFDGDMVDGNLDFFHGLFLLLPGGGKDFREPFPCRDKGILCGFAQSAQRSVLHDHTQPVHGVEGGVAVFPARHRFK